MTHPHSQIAEEITSDISDATSINSASLPAPIYSNFLEVSDSDQEILSQLTSKLFETPREHLDSSLVIGRVEQGFNYVAMPRYGDSQSIEIIVFPYGIKSTADSDTTIAFLRSLLSTSSAVTDIGVTNSPSAEPPPVVTPETQDQLPPLPEREAVPTYPPPPSSENEVRPAESSSLDVASPQSTATNDAGPTLEVQREQLDRQAIAISVKFIAPDGSNAGSGVLIGESQLGNGESLYTVATNEHVVDEESPGGGAPQSVRTHSGVVHSLVDITSSSDIDAALAQFIAPSGEYEIAQILTEDIILGEKAYAYGFPVMDASDVTTGEYVSGSDLFVRESIVSTTVTAKLGTPFQGGYDIAFPGGTLNGMSGGGLYVSDGDRLLLVGLNGRGTPIFPYMVASSEDLEPTEEFLEFVSNNSFAIPIDTVLREFSTQ